MKKSLLLLLTIPFLLAACGGDNAPKDSDPKEEEPQEREEEQEEEEEEEKEELLDEYTATIKLCGNPFTAVASKAGVQFGPKFSENVALLTSYCDDQLEYEYLISSLECKCLNTGDYTGGAILCIGTGYYLNGKFESGTFAWNSGVSMYKVEIKALAYSKYNDYAGVLQIDEPAKVQIDSEEPVELYKAEDGTPVVKTISKSYPDGINSFSITSTGARVFIEEITITWRG